MPSSDPWGYPLEPLRGRFLGLGRAIEMLRRTWKRLAPRERAASIGRGRVKWKDASWISGYVGLRADSGSSAYALDSRESGLVSSPFGLRCMRSVNG